MGVYSISFGPIDRNDGRRKEPISGIGRYKYDDREQPSCLRARFRKTNIPTSPWTEGTAAKALQRCVSCTATTKGGKQQRRSARSDSTSVYKVFHESGKNCTVGRNFR